ncbi:MAG: EamA family transporter, partial [Candidatus Saccharimonadales bacterium]
QQTCSAAVFILVLPFISKSSYQITSKLRHVSRNFLFGAAILQVIGFLAITAGIGRVGNLASIAVAVSACYPVITVFLALKNLGEEFDPIPVIGALTSVIGIVILSVG